MQVFYVPYRSLDALMQVADNLCRTLEVLIQVHRSSDAGPRCYDAGPACSDAGRGML